MCFVDSHWSSIEWAELSWLVRFCYFSARLTRFVVCNCEFKVVGKTSDDGDQRRRNAKPLDDARLLWHGLREFDRRTSKDEDFFEEHGLSRIRWKLKEMTPCFLSSDVISLKHRISTWRPVPFLDEESPFDRNAKSMSKVSKESRTRNNWYDFYNCSNYIIGLRPAFLNELHK